MRSRSCFLLWLLTPLAAHASLKLKWDCYLPNAAVDCVLLQSSLVSKIPFLRMVSTDADADVFVTLTSVPAENATRYELELTGKRVDGYATEVRTGDKIPNTIDPATALVRVMTKLERGLDDFMDQKIAAEVTDGALVIRVIDPNALPFSGRPEQDAVRWYVAPAVSTYFSDVVGVGINASGSAGFTFNYSNPKWRLQNWVGANFSEQSQPVPGTSETASVKFFGGSSNNVLALSLSADSRWSVGVLMAGEKNPQANYTFRANGSLGLEYDLVPRQTVNQRNFGFRCAAGPEFQHYDATNIEGLDEQTVGRQFCDTFFSWHFHAVDLIAALGETSILENISYRSFSAGFSANWRVTDNITVSPWISFQQVNQAINEAQPTTTVYTDAKQEIEASMIAAVQQGYTAPFGVQSGLSVRYLFGNGSLSSEDQRWKATSNLR